MNQLKFMLQVTEQCNLSCVYCSSNLPYTKYKEEKELNINEFILIMEYIKKYIPQDFYINYIITGGEPSLYKYIKQLIKIIQKDRHSHRIYIRTNSFTLYDKIFNGISNVCFDITYHYNIVLDNIRQQYLETILHNIRFLLDNDNLCNLNILSIDELSTKITDDILSQYRAICHNDNAPYEIKTAKQTANYTPHTNNINPYFNKKIYLYRIIKLMPDYTFCYGCDIANKYIIQPKHKKYIDLRYNYIWKIIQSKLHKQEVCVLSDCSCHVCQL